MMTRAAFFMFVSKETILEARSKALLSLLALAAPFQPLTADPGPASIRHSTFEDFAAGEFPDGGRNVYVARDGTIQLIHRWDLNRDGHLDLLFTQDMTYVTETPDALIYWGSHEGFVSLFPPMWEQRPRFSLLENILNSQDRFLRLPSFGGGPSEIADLNRDGYPDIVFVNLIHNYTHRLNAYIYWGGPDPYSTRERTQLPTFFAHDLAVVDLDQDDYLDLVFANRGDFEGERRFGSRDNRESYVYWGSPAGFSSNNRTSLPTHNAVSCAAGDFNGDGFPDLSFLNAPLSEDQSVVVYYGGTEVPGFDRNTSLPVRGRTRLEAFRLNDDSFSELVVMGEEEDSVILFGRRETLSIDHSIVLPTQGANDVAAEDLNNDGQTDIVFANLQGDDSFLYWGSPGGYSTQRRTSLPTLGASAIAVSDLNQDRFLDLLFANYKDATGHDVPSYIYWGSAEGFAPSARSEIQGFGAVSVAVEDLNQDGMKDILLVNQSSGFYPNRVNGLIFWGNPHHYYSASSMSVLSNIPDGQFTTTDLNNDGWPDLVTGSTICWGSASGLEEHERTILPSAGDLRGNRVADLDRDGYLDLLFSQRDEKGDYSGAIYWGSLDGFSSRKPEVFELPGRVAHPTLADLNRDGYLDMVNAALDGNSSILWGSASGFGGANRTFLKTDPSNTSQVADLNGDGWLDIVFCGSFSIRNRSRKAESYVYFGSANGLLTDAPIKLTGYSTLEVSIADLNRDSFLDLVFSNYSAGLNRSLPVFVYWGSAEGTFSDNRRTDLPAESSAGIQVLDLDKNGYRDIVVHNHIKDGKHDFGAFIYWGDKEGFRLDHRTHLPTTATHMSNMMSPGNIYTRSPEEEYLSAPIRIPETLKLSQLSWKAETPWSTNVRFQIRAAEDRENLDDYPWLGPAGPESFFERTPADLPRWIGEKKWLQYRIILSTTDGGSSPVIEEVVFEGQKIN
jgi:hypothetical protein